MSFHVRRKDREITELHEMHRVLKATKYVTIALCMEGEPYLVSLSHGYDQKRNCLYFHCASDGKKLIHAEANPKVWGQAVLEFGVAQECDYAYSSVHFSGKFSLITDLNEKKHAMEVLILQVSLDPEEKLAKLKPEKLESVTMGRIDINYMSGKSTKRQK